MNKPKLAALLVLAIAACAAQARAADDRPIEIGGGVGAVGSWWTGPFSGGDLRMVVPAGTRGDVETLVALQAPSSGETLGFYGVQYKLRLGAPRSSRVQPFLTFGGIGVFYHEDRESMVTPPLIGVIGGGFEQRVSHRLAVRVDAQAIVLAVIPVGVRVAAGVTIPIGHLSATTAAGAAR